MISFVDDFQKKSFCSENYPFFQNELNFIQLLEDKLKIQGFVLIRAVLYLLSVSVDFSFLYK